MSADDAGTSSEETDVGGAAPDGDAPDATSGDTTEERVRAALREVIDPCSAATGSNLDVVEMGLVAAIDVRAGDGAGDHVRVDLRLTSPMCHMVPYFYEEIEGRVGDLDGVASAALETDGGLEWTEELLSEAARRKRQAVLDDQEARYRREMGLPEG